MLADNPKKNRISTAKIAPDSAFFSPIVPFFLPFLPEIAAYTVNLAPKVLKSLQELLFVRTDLIEVMPDVERRRWPRLPLPIPVFVRSQDDGGKDLLEFASALNVSAGGMLVAVRRCLPVSAQVELEIPSAPILPSDSRQRLARMLGARTLRIVHGEGYHLVALKFSRPLANNVPVRPVRRKVASLV